MIWKLMKLILNLLKKLNECIDIMAPEKTSTFPHQNIKRGMGDKGIIDFQ